MGDERPLAKAAAIRGARFIWSGMDALFCRDEVALGTHGSSRGSIGLCAGLSATADKPGRGSRSADVRLSLVLFRWPARQEAHSRPAAHADGS
jgi:hypothetical protein